MLRTLARLHKGVSVARALALGAAATPTEDARWWARALELAHATWADTILATASATSSGARADLAGAPGTAAPGSGAGASSARLGGGVPVPAAVLEAVQVDLAAAVVVAVEGLREAVASLAGALRDGAPEVATAASCWSGKPGFIAARPSPLSQPPPAVPAHASAVPELVPPSASVMKALRHVGACRKAVHDWLAWIADAVAAMLRPDISGRTAQAMTADQLDAAAEGPGLRWWQALLYGTDVELHLPLSTSAAKTPASPALTLADGVLPVLIDVVLAGVASPDTVGRAVRLLAVLLVRMHDPVACVREVTADTKTAGELVRAVVGRMAVVLGALPTVVDRMAEPPVMQPDVPNLFSWTAQGR